MAPIATRKRKATNAIRLGENAVAMAKTVSIVMVMMMVILRPILQRNETIVTGVGYDR